MDICIKCKQPISYNPFLCDLCGGSLCLSCMGDDSVGFCDDCTDIQMVSLAEAIPQQKCTYCARDALVVEICFEKDKKSKTDNQTPLACHNQIRVCKEHIVKCTVCDKMLCQQCAINKLCYKHLKHCWSCSKYYSSNKMLKCVTCGKGSCGTCAWKQNASLIPGDPNEDEINNQGNKINSMICEIHVKRCWCHYTIREAPMYRCTHPDCTQYACESGHFKSLVKKTIYACHQHRLTCNICYKEYPIINNKSIKFRGQHASSCCSNCYGQFYDGVIGLLQVCKRLINLPGDVKNLIFHIHVELLKKPLILIQNTLSK